MIVNVNCNRVSAECGREAPFLRQPCDHDRVIY